MPLAKATLLATWLTPPLRELQGFHNRVLFKGNYCRAVGFHNRVPLVVFTFPAVSRHDSSLHFVLVAGANTHTILTLAITAMFEVPGLVFRVSKFNP